MYIHTYKHVQAIFIRDGGRKGAGGGGGGNISVYADETNLVINCVL